MINDVFQAHRYGVDYPGFQGKDLNPDKHRWINNIYGRQEITLK
jgi:hypothetical protein